MKLSTMTWDDAERATARKALKAHDVPFPGGRDA